MKKLKISLITLLLMFALIFLSHAKVQATSAYDNTTFNADYYLNTYSDLKAAFGNNAKAAYDHYMSCGIREGRRGCISFDIQYYLNSHPDLLKTFGAGNYLAAYQHFLTFGIKEGRSTSPYFDVKYYLSHYSDLKKAFGSDYAAAHRHFSIFGIKEGRRASAYFDVSYYINHYSDLKKAFQTNYASAFRHYVTNGMREGRNPCQEIQIQCYLNSYSDLQKAFGKNYEKVAEHCYIFGLREKRSTSHRYTKTTKAATCTTAGKYTYTCKCGDSYEQTIPATGHQFVDMPAKAATCKEPGYSAYKKCTKCGYIQNKTNIPVQSNNHSWNKGVVTAPVHTTSTLTDGYTTYTCTLCGKTKKENIQKAEHTLKVSTSVAPTHESTGYTLYSCSYPGCQYTEKRNETKKLHQDAIEDCRVEPTCTTDGYTGKKCTICQEVFAKVTIPLTGHHLIDVPAKDATCKDPGYSAHKKCTKCDYTQDKTTIPPHSNHSWDSGVVTPPVHTTDTLTDGYTTYTCTVCQTTKKEPGEKAEHTLKYYTTVGSTHETAGYVVNVCTYDGCQYETRTPIAKLHEGSVIVTQTVASTCQTKGYIDRQCSKCGYQLKREYTPLSGHQLVEVEKLEPTCTTDGHQAGKKCSTPNCKYQEGMEKIAKTGHSLSQDPIESVESVHQKGLPFVEGYKIYKCTNANCPEPEAKVKVMNQDIVHESRYVVHPAVHTATKLECAYNALECSICGRISRKIPIETEANHKVIQVESQEATCGTSGHGAGTRCISEDCAFNTQGGGATAYNTSAPTGHHTFEYRNLTTNEKVANDQNAVQINVCKTCGTQSEDKPYLTLAEVFETSDVVVIYGDFYARNMTIPVGKTLIVYGSFVLYQGNVNNGNLYYKNLMKSNIASITKDGTLISESNEASVKDIIEKAQSLREFEKPVDTP